jgi:hypothetical protein
MNVRNCILLLFIALISHGALMGQSGIYAGGPVYKNRSYSISELRNSGFKFIDVWTIHIDASGNFNFNAEFPLVSNGSYIGASTYPNFASDIALLKTAPTSITRIEFCLAAWGSSTFANVKNLIASQGTGTSSILYKNFLALKNAFPAVDAIAFDDETSYDVSSSVALAVMLGKIGFKVTLVPYTNSGYWTSVATNTNSQLAGTVTRVDLQCYSGGAGNSPCNWSFGSIPVYAGLWDQEKTTAQVTSTLTGWKNTCSSILKGGFIWLYDDIDNSSATASYAAAVNAAFSATGTGVVTFYKDCNYGGYAISLPVGSYTLSQLQSYGIVNDDISSIVVNSGYKTTVYADDNFSGSSLAVTASTSCLVSAGWNDRISSLTIAAASSARAVNNIGIEKPLVVYPNPAQQELKVNTDLQGTLVQVFDMGGRQVITLKPNSNSIDISRLTPGVYTLVVTKNGSRTTRQFIKQ